MMGIAFEMVCAALKRSPNDELKPVIAAKIVELAKAGERSQPALRAGADRSPRLAGAGRRHPTTLMENIIAQQIVALIGK
jgi:hypothetical protein